MLTLLFEVRPKSGQEAAYLDMAAKLRPALDASGGLLFLDRSRSEERAGWFLSHQYWRDEASMARWRANGAHYRAQACGRTDILADYRLRVGQVVAEIAQEMATDRGVVRYRQEPAATYDQSDRPARFVLTMAARGAIESGWPSGMSQFNSVYDANLAIGIVDVASAAAGEGLLSRLAVEPAVAIARLSVVSRDYGMFDRAEAPQYFEPVATLA